MRPRDVLKIQKTFDAALTIIASEGMAGLKMQQLAHAAGLATGTLYIYFNDKPDLLHQMYLHYSQKMHRIIWGETNPDTPFPMRLRQKWYNYLRYIEQFPNEMVFLEQYHRSPYANVSNLSAKNTLLEPLLEIIEEGQRIGMLQKIPSALILAYICGSVQELVRGSAEGNLPPVTDITHFAWEMTWKAIAE